MPRIAYWLEESELQWSAVRAQGAGGQNVNKVSNAMVLRFDVPASSLPEALKARLLAWPDARISKDGVIGIKAQEHRSQPRNRDEALLRLRELLDAAAHLPTRRVATRPTRASRERRLSDKARTSGLKAERRGPTD
jgi:ribosome-associated protein